MRFLALFLLLTCCGPVTAREASLRVEVQSEGPATLSWSYSRGNRQGHVVPADVSHPNVFQFTVPLDEERFEVDLLVVGQHGWLGSYVDRTATVKLKEGENSPVRLTTRFVYNPVTLALIAVTGFPFCLFLLWVTGRTKAD